MSDTPAQLLEVVRRLRNDGYRVEPVPGWETRGKGPMTTRGRIEHHTATARSVPGDAPTLRIVTYGHGSLRNSLSRWYVSRTGVIYLVAAGVSWHAGRGGKGTNTTLSGTEAEHSGRTSEPWSAASLVAQAAISRHEADVLGFSTSWVWEHREHAPSRKTDRAGIDGADWRRRLASDPPSEEDIVATLDQLRQTITDTVPVIVEQALAPLRSMVSQARDRTNEAIRLSQACATAEVARIRAEAGLEADPASDALHVSRIRNGEYGLDEVRTRLQTKAGA